MMNITSIYNKIETEFSIINDANSLISIAVRGINTDGSLCTLNGFTASKKLMELVFMELKPWQIYSSRTLTQKEVVNIVIKSGEYTCINGKEYKVILKDRNGKKLYNK